MLKNVPKLGSIVEMAKIKLPKEPETVSFTLRISKNLNSRIEVKRKSLKGKKLSRQQLIETMLDQLIDDLVIEEKK